MTDAKAMLAKALAYFRVCNAHYATLHAAVGADPATDITVGWLLSRMAAQSGAVYTLCRGDEPAEALKLVEFARDREKEGKSTYDATVQASTPGGGTVVSDPSSARIDDVVTAPADPADPATVLAHTGSTIAWGLGVAALGMTVLGAVLLILRRRRPQN